MLSLLLWASLAAAPSAVSLAEAGQLQGALIRVEELAPQVDAGPQIPLAQMTRAQLRAEYHRIEESRPPIAGQITAIILGGCTIAAGGVVLFGSLLVGLFSTVPLSTVIIGIGLVLGGGILLTFGIVMLRMAMAERQPYNEAMQEVQERIDGTWDENHGIQPRVPPVEKLPPPPPPPPAAGFETVRPSLVLARF